jgi:hypothetical protein
VSLTCYQQVSRVISRCCCTGLCRGARGCVEPPQEMTCWAGCQSVCDPTTPIGRRCRCCAGFCGGAGAAAAGGAGRGAAVHRHAAHGAGRVAGGGSRGAARRGVSARGLSGVAAGWPACVIAGAALCCTCGLCCGCWRCCQWANAAQLLHCEQSRPCACPGSCCFEAVHCGQLALVWPATAESLAPASV